MKEGWRRIRGALGMGPRRATGWAPVGAVAVLLASCAPPYGDETQRVEGALEAVARWAFANADTDLEPPAAYCIAVPEAGEEEVRREPAADPTDPFLQRFADVAVPVRPLSACRILSIYDLQDSTSTMQEVRVRTRHTIVDRASGGFGLLIALGPVRWTGDAAAEVHVLAMQGMHWGKGGRCEVAWDEANGWRVLGCPVTWPM